MRTITGTKGPFVDSSALFHNTPSLSRPSSHLPRAHHPTPLSNHTIIPSQLTRPALPPILPHRPHQVLPSLKQPQNPSQKRRKLNVSCPQLSHSLMKSLDNLRPISISLLNQHKEFQRIVPARDPRGLRNPLSVQVHEARGLERGWGVVVEDVGHPGGVLEFCRGMGFCAPGTGVLVLVSFESGFDGVPGLLEGLSEAALEEFVFDVAKDQTWSIFWSCEVVAFEEDGVAVFEFVSFAGCCWLRLRMVWRGSGCE